jgi:hypothetical protein
MFCVDAVSRELIDGWPVEEAGLPTRVINSVHAAGVRTVGELRGWSDDELLGLHSLGRVSLDQIHYFYRLCDRIERGQQRFEAIQEVLDVFLDAAQLHVLSSRYGLYQRSLRASRSWVTLQEIGNRENKTRERIRQVEELAKQRLSSRMAMVCLEPFLTFFIQYIDQRARVLSGEHLAPIRHHEALRDLNPAGMLLLLSDLAPERITFHHEVFSTLSAAEMDRVIGGARKLLKRRPGPVGVDELATAVAPLPGLQDGGVVRQAVSVILDHAPEIGATIDDRYFLFSSSVQPYLLELMQRMELPVHYRAVTARYNDHVKPRSRRGAGFILDALNRNAQCLRTDRGIYTLTAA